MNLAGVLKQAAFGALRGDIIPDATFCQPYREEPIPAREVSFRFLQGD